MNATLRENVLQESMVSASHWQQSSESAYSASQSVRYSTVSGIFTYKPVNVSGAYNGQADFDFSSHIGHKMHWT